MLSLIKLMSILRVRKLGFRVVYARTRPFDFDVVLSRAYWSGQNDDPSTYSEGPSLLLISKYPAVQITSILSFIVVGSMYLRAGMPLGQVNTGSVYYWGR